MSRLVITNARCKHWRTLVTNGNRSMRKWQRNTQTCRKNSRTWNKQWEMSDRGLVFFFKTIINKSSAPCLPLSFSPRWGFVPAAIGHIAFLYLITSLLISVFLKSFISILFLVYQMHPRVALLFDFNNIEHY